MIAKYLLPSLPAVVLGGALLSGFGASDVGARSTCEAQIDRAEAKLSDDVYHHGRYSHQANHDRARLDRLYQLCTVPATRRTYAAPAPYPSSSYSTPYAAPYSSPYPAPNPYYRGY